MSQTDRMGMVIALTYGFFAVITILNYSLMPRPGLRSGNKSKLAFLIPARDEAENLGVLVPALVQQLNGVHEVWVFDDESSDETADIASRNGANVVRAPEPLPLGWTGKNRACHSLAGEVLARTDAHWLVFLDADVRPGPDFVAGLLTLMDQGEPVITGFPKFVSGKFPQGLFLGWVGWILLATNPFGLVARTRKGHNGFTNGQFQAWRRDVYQKMMPNERLKSAILEDVQIGRLCAKSGVPILVANVSSILSVKMYDTWQETLDGMSKNSYEIAGSAIGSVLVAALLLTVGWMWLFSGPLVVGSIAFLISSGMFCALTVKAKPFGALLMPLVLTIGAYTVLRSLYWKKAQLVRWKGRTYL